MRKFTHVAIPFERTGTEISFYPPDAEVLAEGAPTSAATYSVWRGTDGNSATVMFSGTATLDSVSTTVSSASGYSQTNRRALTLTATTNTAVGERYLLTNANTKPQREVVTLAQVASATGATTEEDMSFDYASSSTFKGLRHYFTIDATFIATQSNINVWGAQSAGVQTLGAGATTQAPSYRVRWVYTTGSVTRESWTAFDVVRKPGKANLGIADLRSIAPDIEFLSSTTQRGQDWQPQLVRAESDVNLDLRGDGYDAATITDPEFYDRLVLWKWAEVCGLALWFSGRKPDWYDHVALQYAQLRAKFTATTLRATVTDGVTGASIADPAQQLWFR